MCHVQEWQLSLSYFLSYFSLTVSNAILCPLINLKILWYFIMILKNLDDGSGTRMKTLTYILSELFPLDAISCLLHYLNVLLVYYHNILQL